LREVLLAKPAMTAEGDPDSHLLLDWPDPDLLDAQVAQVGAFYESRGIRVHWAQAMGNLPNFLFQRDLFFMTPEGAVLARPASPQRAAEARWTARALAEVGVPILATPRGTVHFEGADALWISPDTVLLGQGFRTNKEGADFLASVLAQQGVSTHVVVLPAGVQHLLGVVNLLDEDLAAIDGARAGAPLRALLSETRELLEIPPGPEISKGLALNFVTLAPRSVVMPAGCPDAQALLENAGVGVSTLEISEYKKAAGGLGCLTGLLSRG
jgi:N-dimethylarginine dimethylaminohydrolase